MTRAYSYLRFSTPEQMLGDSYRRQTQLAQEYAARRGLVLDDSLRFEDKGVSAYRGKNAKVGALRAFLDAVEAGAVEEGSYLLVESLDRISRDAILAAQGLFLQIIQSGVTLVTLVDGREYSEASVNANPTDLIISLLTMMRANEESAMKARRLKAAWQGKRAKATERPLTAIAPAWLRLDRATGKFEVIEERAAVVRRVFQMTLEGVGQHTISATLNRENVSVFGRGMHWHRSYVFKLLENPAVIGRCIPHQIEFVDGRKTRKPLDPIDGYFPAIIDSGTFDRVQAMRLDTAAPLRGRHVTGKLNNLFGGLARCPLCGSTMTLVNKGPKGGRKGLACSRAKEGAGCRYRMVPYQTVEDAFRANVEQLIANAPAGDGGERIDAEIEATEQSIDGMQEALGNLLDALAAGPSPAISERVRETESALEELRRHLDQLWRRKAAVQGPLLERKLSDLDTALRAPAVDRAMVNALLRQVFSAAIIDYRSGQLVLAWRHGGESSVIFAWPEEEVA
jgi:DNA invertase Pin-like site-specific DNA recombinase